MGVGRRAVHPRVSRQAVFAFCVLHSAFFACAKAPPATTPIALPPAVDPLQQLRTDIDTLLDRPGHRYGHWGIVVESLARSDRLYERDPRTLLVPASTLKLVTVAVAGEAVGWDYRFETQLLATGPIVNGVLKGDLLIVGSGDPSLLGPPGTDLMSPATPISTPWVDALRQRGVTRIDGRVIADDDSADEPRAGFAWSWDDLGFAYGALAGALNVAENVTTLAVSPGNAVGLPTIVEPLPGGANLPVVNHSTTALPGGKPTLWPEFRPGDGALAIHGTIPAGAGPVKVVAAVGNPTLWFARVVRHDLLKAGIDVTGPPSDGDEVPIVPSRLGATLLHAHLSPPLSDVVKPLMKDSLNLYAETVLWLATGREGPRSTGAALDAARLRLQQWGIPPEGIQIVDGSGLSRRDVLSAETLITILRRFYDPAGASPWMQSFPIAGRDGSLEKRMIGTAAEGNALAKTGSMSNIRTLAGYVKTADGEPLAFAILANNFEGPASGVTATIDAIVARLSSLSRAARVTVSR
jgi:D-alanyl-D-alanine carboxypeptidase/D-alanyl-D-alanine-endopeptidase (penicillin-binding protein 4)